MAAFRLALIQLEVSPRKDENLSRAVELLEEAAGQDVRLALLPEMWNVSYAQQDYTLTAEPIPDGPTCRLLADSAARLGIYLAGGSIAELDQGRVYNTATLWSPRGELLLKHRKVHLFDVDIPGGITFRESDFLAPGDRVSLVKTELGTLGLAICYDVRFPELFRLMALGGAELILLPGAFNTTTGPAHWEVNLRCRAMENTCYLAACSPAPHPEVAYPAWGHSMLVDPYGAVLVSAERREAVVTGLFDRARLAEVRQALPFLSQRRPDVYGRDWLK